MRVSLRTTTMVAALAAAAIALGACGAPQDAPPAAVSAGAAQREYAAEQHHLELAPGWSWPGQPAYATTGPDGAPMTYQQGYGTTQADHYWYCSWESAATARPATSTSRAAALGEVEQVRRTHLYRQDVLAVDRPAFDAVLDQALAGRPHLMRRDVRLNCPAAPGV